MLKVNTEENPAQEINWQDSYSVLAVSLSLMPVWTGGRYDNYSGFKIPCVKNKNWSRWSYFKDPCLKDEMCQCKLIITKFWQIEEGRLADHKIGPAQTMTLIKNITGWKWYYHLGSCVWWDLGLHKQLKGANCPTSGVFLAAGIFNAKRGDVFQTSLYRKVPWAF